MKALLGAALLLFTLAQSAPGWSRTPDVWQAAAHPRWARDAQVLQQAQRLFVQAQQLRLHTESGQNLLRLVRYQLADIDAAHSPDVRVRILYGRVLELLGQEAQATSVLQSAVVLAPNYPDMVDAYFALAVCYAKQGKVHEEIAAYEALLRREPLVEARSTALSNQAEAYMLDGNLERAQKGYRAALELAPDNVLARWGLAVALDRSGDPYTAWSEAEQALLADPGMQKLNSAEVFFVPPYDRFWYLALAAMAQARQRQTSSALTAQHWQNAAQLWLEYLQEASPTDRWLAMAKQRYALCQRQLELAQRQPRRASAQR